MKNFLFFLVLVLTGLATVQNVSACTCSGPRNFYQGVQTCGMYWAGDPIFVGTAESISTESNGQWKVTFSVEKMVRGTSSETFDVYTSADSAMCGYPFRQGEKYLVYGRKNKDGNLHEGLCGPTVLLKNAEADLEYVRDIESGLVGTRIFGTVGEVVQKSVQDKLVGAKVPGIEITIRSETNKKQKFKTTTDENGFFLFREIPYDSYLITAALPTGLRELFTRADLTDHRVGINAERRCGGTYFNTTRQGSIRGKIVDEKGKPATQQQLSLQPLDDSRNPLLNIQMNAKYANKINGEFYFDAVPAGEYLLSVNPNNCPYPKHGTPPTYFPGVADRSSSKIITIREGENLDVKQFRMLPTLMERWFTGIVKFADGTVAVNAKVSLLDGENRSCGGGEYSKVSTDEQGRFRVLAYQGYTYRIRAYTDKFQPRGRKDIYTMPIPVPVNGNFDGIEFILNPRP